MNSGSALERVLRIGFKRIIGEKRTLLKEMLNYYELDIIVPEATIDPFL